MRGEQSVLDQFRNGNALAVRFGPVALLFGVLVGVGTAGLIGGGLAAQAFVSIAVAAVLTAGLSLVLCRLASAYLPQGRAKAVFGRSGATGTEPLAADGSGERE